MERKSCKLYLQGHGLKVGDEVPVDRDTEQGIIRGVRQKRHGGTRQCQKRGMINYCRSAGIEIEDHERTAAPIPVVIARVRKRLTCAVEVLEFLLTCGHEWSLHAKGRGESACSSDGCGCPGFAFFAHAKSGASASAPRNSPPNACNGKARSFRKSSLCQEQLRDANNQLTTLPRGIAATMREFIDRSFERKSAVRNGQNHGVQESGMSQAQYRIVMMKVEPPVTAAIVSLCQQHYERVIDETMTSERCDFVPVVSFVIDRKAKVKCDACHDNHPLCLTMFLGNAWGSSVVLPDRQDD